MLQTVPWKAIDEKQALIYYSYMMCVIWKIGLVGEEEEWGEVKGFWSAKSKPVQTEM